MKKKILIPGICVLCLLVTLAAAAAKYTAVIGTVQGAECETVVIGGTAYQLTDAPGLSAADKGKFLGWVTNRSVKFRVYAVKNDPEHRYIYRLWGYDGAFYTKTD